MKTMNIKIYRHPQVDVPLSESTVAYLLGVAMSLSDLITDYKIKAIDASGREYTLSASRTEPGSVYLHSATKYDSLHMYGDLNDLRRWFGKRLALPNAIARLTAMADVWPTERQLIIADKVKWLGYCESPEE